MTNGKAERLEIEAVSLQMFADHITQHPNHKCVNASSGLFKERRRKKWNKSFEGTTIATPGHALTNNSQ